VKEECSIAVIKSREIRIQNRLKRKRVKVKYSHTCTRSCCCCTYTKTSSAIQERVIEGRKKERVSFDIKWMPNKPNGTTSLLPKLTLALFVRVCVFFMSTFTFVLVVLVAIIHRVEADRRQQLSLSPSPQLDL